MSTTTSLQEHKNKKIYEKVIRDLKAVLQILTLAQKGLTLFKNYVSVQEIISVINTNVTLMDLKITDYEKKLKAIVDKE